MKKPFIINIIIVVVILMIVFLSQQPMLQKIGNNLYSKAKTNGYNNYQKGSEWFKTNIYPRVKSEVDKRGEVVKEEVNKQKNNILQRAWESIKNYLAEKFSNISGVKVE